MNDIKLIISDLDGTLLNEEKLVSDATKQAIEACKNKGIYFGIATGRPLEPSLELVQEWGINDLCDFVLAMNGAELFDCKKKEKTCFFQIEPSVVKGIMDHFSNMKVRFYIFEDNTRYVNYSDEETKKDAATYRENEVQADLYALCTHPFTKVSVECDPKDIEQIVEHGKQFKGGHCTGYKSAPHLYEYVDSRVNKSYGIQQLCNKIGITMENVITFGDTSNDIDMLRDAGISVCMSNGTSDAKEVADVITLSNKDDGVAYYLNTYIL